MPVGVISVVMATGTSGAGTTSTRSLSGEVLSVRIPGAGTALLGPGGTAIVTITDALTGGTVLAKTAASAPFQFQPRNALHTTAGGTTFITAGSAVSAVDPSGIPFAGILTAVVTQGGTSATGTMYITYRR